jgi:hypothetical protein
MLSEEEGYSTTSGALYPRGPRPRTNLLVYTVHPRPFRSPYKLSFTRPARSKSHLWILLFSSQRAGVPVPTDEPCHCEFYTLPSSVVSHSVLSVKMVISYQHLKRSCSNISENSLKGRSLFEVKSYNISPVYYCKPPHSITLTIFHCFMILCLTFIIQNLKMVSINAQFKNCFVYHVPLAYPLIDFSANVNNFTF